MSQWSSVSPPLPTTTSFSTLILDALDVVEVCAASAAAPLIPRKVRRTIGRLLGIGELYCNHAFRPEPTWPYHAPPAPLTREGFSDLQVALICAHRGSSASQIVFAHR